MIASAARARAFAAVVAAVAWCGLALQMALLVRDFVADGEGALAAVWRFFAYFTLLTNLLVALVASGAALGGRFTPSVQVLTATTLYIAIVGVVYHFILSATWSPAGWSFVADKIVHYATPVLMAAYWIACVPKGRHRWRDVVGWLGYPVGYLIYAVARGALDGFYPYFFIDLPRIGWSALAVNAAALFAFFLAAGLGLVAIDRWMGRRVSGAG
ncbi:MAG: Pr6Pr family membrane protein [Hyphomonadaceae bacterium]|nr:Pr6Pr family membrane protein [Hyphomonadaceae bacterium]